MKFFDREVACGPVQAVCLELYGVKIRTEEISIALYSRFEADIDGGVYTVDPVLGAGDVAGLWQLVGRDILTLASNESKFEMDISGGARIVCEFASGNEHVNIWGPGPDTFTALPEHQA